MESTNEGRPQPIDTRIPEQPGPERGPHSELIALSRVSAAVSGLRDLDGIFEVALDTVLDVMNGSIGWVQLVDEAEEALTIKVLRGLPEKYRPEMRLKLGEGIAGVVAETGKAILVEDLSVDARAAWPNIISNEDLKAFVSVPLRAKDTVLGVLNVTSREPHHFTRDDMHLLHAIGDQVGVAIEQAELYNRLRKGRERYQRLAQHILVAQEDERKRVARELHDETSQTLSGLALSLQALVQRSESASGLDASFKEQLQKAQSLAVQVSTEVGRLIHELRPALLDTLGLVPAIRRYAEDILRPVGITVSLETQGEPIALPPEVEVGLYRVAQGTLGNILRHSGARNVTISIDYKGDHLLLRVQDDGEGFDVSKLTGVDERGRGSGVFGMKERVKLMGGSCSIQSQPGQGTLITVRVPSTRSMDVVDED
jgi:signal transduction histidine kinase